MPKYKYFLLFFSCIAILLLLCFFPISFDNNDDQVMFAISSGFLSSNHSPNLLLTNIIIGSLLSKAFQLSSKINWYTLYLQIAQTLSFLAVCYIFIENKKYKFLNSILIILIIFLGFFSLCFVKLQFTAVALFCCFTALFCMQSESNNRIKLGFSLFFITLSILIRKDVFYIFMLFSIAVLFISLKVRKDTKIQFLIIAFSILIFSVLVFVNSNNKTYKQQHTYRNIETLDIIAGKPIKIKDEVLKKNNFTKDDILLMQSWFFADDTYFADNKLELVANEIKSIRTFNEVKLELKKFIVDERYILVFYVLSVLIVLFFARIHYAIMVVNFLLFTLLFFYLIFTSRIPHRITFPILTYLILINIFYFLKNENSLFIRNSALSLFVIISAYKFYCTSKLIKINHDNHSIFNACKNEIKDHSNYLFIALDDFPMQYMNAWQTPENIFTANNVMLTGWYACTPDYQVLLHQYKIKNLTSDIIYKQNVLFLTNSETLQIAYVNVIKQRYNINCHFENVQDGFLYLHPKKLVIDN